MYDNRWLNRLSLILVVVVGCGLMASEQIGSHFLIWKAQGISAQLMTADLRSEDKAFLRQATRINLAGIEMGRLAQQHADNPAVRQFADRMLIDHSRADIDLRELASVNGVALPETVDDMDDAAEQHLSSLSGKQFDSEYISAVVTVLSRDITQFLQEKDSLVDPQVKTFAAKMITMLQNHLSEAQQINLAP